MQKTDSLQANYTASIEPDSVNNMDIQMWEDDSFLIASTSVYAHAIEDKPLPDDYVKNNQEIIKKQIVVGGHRLAYVINFIFGADSQSTTYIEESAFLA